MTTSDELRDLTERHIVYRYIGTGGRYLMGVPKRDLISEDLLGVYQREGITRADIEASGLYELVEYQTEVEPFCGASTGDGKHCSRKVKKWGERCYQHKEDKE